MVYPYNGVLVDNKKEYTADMHNNIDNSQMMMLSERSLKKGNVYGMVPFTQNFRKCRLMYNNKKQINGYLTLWEEVGEEVQETVEKNCKGTQEVSRGDWLCSHPLDFGSGSMGGLKTCEIAIFHV